MTTPTQRHFWRYLRIFPLLFILLAVCSVQTKAQQMPKFDFLATHYDVQATLHPADQTFSAIATVGFMTKATSRTVTVELHPDLNVHSIRLSNGQKLDFLRDAGNPLELVITLPSAAKAGEHLTLTFDYAGAFSNDDDSPTKDVRFAWIDKNSAYLLLPARWFPLTAYPSNRYTATFKISVPDTFAVVGTGQSAAPNEIPPAKPGEPGQAVYTFACEQPGPVGTFVAGNLRLAPVRAQGLEISVFTPPSANATTTPYGDALASIVNYFSAQFGPLPAANLTLVQLPDGSVSDFSAPGVLLLSAREWGNKVNEGALAHLAAQQWWGDQVLPASPADGWVTDGLARYAQALYAEHTEGIQGLHSALTDFSIGALMYEDAAPIAQAQRLQPYSQQYQSVVVDKGAMVFHMLRSAMGNAPFQSLLQDFYRTYAGKTASDDDFEALAQTKLPPPAKGQPRLNLVAFFSQWLNSTGVPEFSLNYIVYRTEKGFKVVGKVSQPLETFNMPVDIRVDTEGNPVTKTVDVIGPTTEFEIDTFGRPKPSGIIVDPDNNILKSSSRLRVMSLVARGAGLAEQGKFYDAIHQYQLALNIQPNNSLAEFRLGEAFFYQKNYSASADSFRNALDGDLDPSYKWVEVWSHIYLGKIFDLTGSRERAINEYNKAEQLKDDTGGAQEEARRYIHSPYASGGASTTTKNTKR